MADEVSANWVIFKDEFNTTLCIRLDMILWFIPMKNAVQTAIFMRNGTKLIVNETFDNVKTKMWTK